MAFNTIYKCIFGNIFLLTYFLKTYCFISSSSMSHFTCAMFSKLSAQSPAHTPSSSTLEIEDLEPERKFTCPQAGCLKAYRQTSGLRYHLKHVCRYSFFLVSLLLNFLKGHPPDMPAQLPIVPPMLEQQMSAKIKRLRPKPPPESIIV
jgi:hypothetical protein